MKLRILIVIVLLVQQLSFGQQKLIDLEKSNDYKTYTFPVTEIKPEEVVILAIKEESWKNLDKISKYKNIQELRIEKSEVSELVIDFSQFPLLQSLYTQESNYDTLIFKGNGIHFKELMLYERHLWSYDFLKTIPSLTDFYISDSLTINLENLTENLLQLKSLTTIGLYDGNIVKLPLSFKKFSKLEWLYFSYQDSSFDYDYNLDLIKEIKVENLTLMTNDAIPLSKSIRLMKNVKTLILTNSSYTSLPEEIGELTQLEELTMSMCNISDLPQSMVKLVNLKRLFLMPCNFKEIPAVLYEMLWLEELEIGSWEWFPSKKELKPLRKKLKKTKVNNLPE